MEEVREARVKDWGSSSWQSQSWDTNSWASKNKSWYDKNTPDSRTRTRSRRRRPTDEKKERDWRKRQAVAYTTHYRGILTAIMPFPAFYYGINKGTYASPEPGQHCDPTTVYPIPTGEHLEFGRSHPAMATFRHPLNLTSWTRTTTTSPTGSPPCCGTSTGRNRMRNNVSAPRLPSRTRLRPDARRWTWSGEVQHPCHMVARQEMDVEALAKTMERGESHQS